MGTKIPYAYVPEAPGLRTGSLATASHNFLSKGPKVTPPAFEGMIIPEGLSIADAHKLMAGQKSSKGELVNQEAIKPINQAVLKPAKEIALAAIDSTKGIGHDLGTVLYGSIKKLLDLNNDSKGMNQLRTWLFGIGGVATSVLGIKSVTRFGKLLYGERKSNFTPFADLVDGVLTLGLSAGLLSPFLGFKSPFRKVINGVVTVAPMRLVGSLAAVLGFKTLLNSAKNTSIFNKLFRMIGIDLQEAIKPFFDGVNWLTTDEQAAQRGGPGQGFPGGGFPGQ